MSAYKIADGGVLCDNGRRFIPDNDKNSHWQEYQEWLVAGNAPDPIDPEPPESDESKLQTLMRRQAMILHDVISQLVADGYLKQNGAHITQQTRDDFVKLQALVESIRSNM